MIARQRLNLFETIDRYQHDMDFEPHSEAMPTATAPGSLEKIQVMQGRLARGEELHHAGDVRMSARIELQAEMARIVQKAVIDGRAAARARREAAGVIDKRVIRRSFIRNKVEGNG